VDVAAITATVKQEFAAKEKTQATRKEAGKVKQSQSRPGLHRHSTESIRICNGMISSPQAITAIARTLVFLPGALCKR
jgi:hypothetical protein